MTRHKILVVDDDQDEQLIFTDYFTEVSEEFDMEFISNGKLALVYLESISDDWSLPRLIVLDLNMPVLNGVQTLERLKSTDRFKHIPVVIFSNADREQDRKVCADLGAEGYFLKPSTLDEAEQIGSCFLSVLHRR